MARPMTYDHLKSKKKPTIRSVTLSIDDELQEEYDQAQAELESARQFAASMNGDGEVRLAEAQDKYDKAKKAAEAATVTFKFRSIGRKKYDELVDQCPPTEDQKKQAVEVGGDPDDLSWDPDKFPKLLCAASIIEPQLTEEQVFEIWESDDWSPSEIAALSVTALEANNTRRIVDLGKG